jgi:hypothetical protein
MIRLLLDHPWPIDEALDERSEGFQVLLEFEKLKNSQQLPLGALVRFIGHQEYNEAMQRIRGKSAGAAAIRRFAYYLIRHGDGIVRATPIPEQNLPNLPPSECWKRALRDELEYPEDWRNPQIIFPKVRQKAWPNTDEIEIKCEDRNGTVLQVLACLEEYESHKYAVPDIDPWRHLEWLKRPQPGARINYPCRLPKPPILEGIPIEQLPEMLAKARRIGWKVGESYYFIPPENYRPELVKQYEWRNGSAFDLETKDTIKGKKIGPIDYEGRIWAFDIFQKRHWDVQLPNGNKLDVSHKGHLVHPI